MKKNNKKGFTLIELLAVLVVLAILALIAIPIVIKVINNAREDSYKRSIEGYARAVEMGLARYAMSHPGEGFPETLSGIIDEKGNSLIDYKGDIVKCDDSIDVSTTGLVTLRYCQVMKNEEEAKSTKYYKYVGNQVEDDVAPVSTTYDKYEVGDTFTFSGSTYYVITPTDEKEQYVTALKAEPLTVDEVTALGFTPDWTYTEKTKPWAGTFYDNTNPSSSAYETSDIRQIVDKWRLSLLLEVKEARLLDYQEIVNNLSEEKVSSTPSGDYVYYSIKYDWAYSDEYWYWTMTSYQDSHNYAWSINMAGAVNGNLSIFNPDGAIRPVITVDKMKVTKQ